MPLGSGTTTTTTTTTMEAESTRGHTPTVSSREESPSANSRSSENPSSSSVNHHHEFGESQCLFCDQESPDLDQNLTHMSKAHGLYIDPTNLLVDVASLLAYFDLVISECHECLYCGTQRNTRQAVQQHMIAKGHCKYDISHGESEYSDFYEFPCSTATTTTTTTEKGQQRRRDFARARGDHSDDPQLPLRVRLRKPRPSRRAEKHADDDTASCSSSSSSSCSSSLSDQEPATSGAVALRSRSRGRVNARALKQEDVLSNQLTQLRAGDRWSLLHLPDSQQRALLATHFKQMEKAKRTEQTQKGRLETTGNTVNCLSKLRLIRKPPHTGNVSSLKH